MNKKPPELPNIEDATLRACLAPLMDAMVASGEAFSPTPPLAAVMPAGGLPRVPPGSNDNPSPVPAARPADGYARGAAGVPATLAEWRSRSDDDFGVFRTIAHFLAMTDAELAAAAVEFPRQIGGTVARLSRMKRRLAARYDTVTTVAALLERAIERAAEGRRFVARDDPDGE